MLHEKQELHRKFLSSQFGKTGEVFVEDSEGDFNVGYTSNYIKVYTKAPAGSFRKHILKELYKNGVKGDLL